MLEMKNSLSLCQVAFIKSRSLGSELMPMFLYCLSEQSERNTVTENRMPFSNQSPIACFITYEKPDRLFYNIRNAMLRNLP